MTIVGMLSGTGVGDGGADASRRGVVSGDDGSGSCVACSRRFSRMAAEPGASSRSEAGAVPADRNNCGGDDALVAPAAPPAARTNRSTSDGRAFSRGRSPTCIQNEVPCVTSSVCAAFRNFPGLVVGFVCRARIMGIVASEVDLPGVALSDRGSEPGNNCLCRPVGFDFLPTRSPSPVLDAALVTLCCALCFANKFPIQSMLES